MYSKCMKSNMWLHVLMLSCSWLRITPYTRAYSKEHAADVSSLCGVFVEEEQCRGKDADKVWDSVAQGERWGRDWEMKRMQTSR